MKQVYLDYAAATPVEADVVKAMHESWSDFANPSARYHSARDSKKVLEQSRKQIAMFVGAKSDEIIFTSGATESNNLAILGSLQDVKVGHIVSAKTEHSSVREPIIELEKKGISVTWCSLMQDGQIDLERFANSLTTNTKLVSIAYANSEIGTVQRLQQIVKITRDFEQANNIKILIHTDVSAAAMLLNINVSRLGVDLMTLSSAKLYGPKAIGALYVKRGANIRPIMYGGNQEASLRAGTESLSLIVGFAKAIEITANCQKADKKEFENLYSLLTKEIFTHYADVILTGSKNHRLPNIGSFIFEGINGEDLVAYLDAKSFEVATGAACEASSDEPSQTLLAIGYSREQAQGSLRVSFGRRTTKEDIKLFTKALQDTLLLLRKQKA